MADRNPSMFGPIVEPSDDAPPAFSFAALQRIRAERLAADEAARGPSGWPETRRFATLYPRQPANSPPTVRHDRVRRIEPTESGVRIIVS